MSGRIYDMGSDPICKECGSDNVATSADRNYHGPRCRECNSNKVEYKTSWFDEWLNRPLKIYDKRKPLNLKQNYWLMNETEQQITDFLRELEERIYGNGSFDFKCRLSYKDRVEAFDLYKKYPRVRIGLRRAMVMVEERRNANNRDQEV